MVFQVSSKNNYSAKLGKQLASKLEKIIKKSQSMIENHDFHASQIEKEKTLNMNGIDSSNYEEKESTPLKNQKIFMDEDREFG